MNSVFIIYIIHVSDELETGALDLDHQDQIGIQTSIVLEKIEPIFNYTCELIIYCLNEKKTLTNLHINLPYKRILNCYWYCINL